MESNQPPSYAVFDDYRYTGRIAIIIRWFLIAVWLTLHNYRPTIDEDFWPLNVMVLSLAALNAYLHWRTRTGRPITWCSSLSASLTW